METPAQSSMRSRNVMGESTSPTPMYPISEQIAQMLYTEVSATSFGGRRSGQAWTMMYRAASSQKQIASGCVYWAMMRPSVRPRTLRMATRTSRFCVADAGVF